MSAGVPFDDDKPKEACGVFGVYAPGQPVAQLTFQGLFALQHRGQESAGMAVSDGTAVTVVKDQGLVVAVFDDRTLAGLDGHLAIGHCRYSTTGSSTRRNSQLPEDCSDERDLERALCRVLPRLEGAFSLVVMDESRVIGVRDPNGFRPLCLGHLEHGHVLASESPALDIVGATFDRELEPGEMVVIDATGPRSLRPFPDDRVDPRLCLFEFVYFARPDTQLYGRNVHQARVRMGELLAEQAPVEADMVMGVPESGVPAAEGFARRSGIPYGQGLVKNRYIGRSFIAPSQALRAQAVRMKLNPLKENLEGKRVVVVDDTIVRGTTQQQLTRMLREAGAVEVHLRITAPPVAWSCFYGIDTGDRSELLAASMSVEEIRRHLNVDTLAYLDLDRLVDATGAVGAGFCDACFTGSYPVSVPVTLRKLVLEEPTSAAPGTPVQTAIY